MSQRANSTTQCAAGIARHKHPGNREPPHPSAWLQLLGGTRHRKINSSSNPATFNPVDPPERNTVGVPKGGWVALRFRADNPSVWFMHCHLEVHTSWGLKTAFLVTNGKTQDQTLEAPPMDLPSC
ncbi:hypothetical protein L7F22_066052 [Adiantum nelumboides]|nr:hypothetical protein [Adiantum nelumboides]